MSTENEGNEGKAPAVPSAPPVPETAPDTAPHAAASEGMPASEGTPPSGPSRPQGTGHQGTGSAPEGGPYAAPPAGAVAGEPLGAPAGDPVQAPTVSQAAAAGWPPPPPVHPPYGSGGDAAYGGTGDAAYGGGQGYGAGQAYGAGAPEYGGGGQGTAVWGAPVPGHGPKQPPRRSAGLITAVLVAALVAGGVGGGVGYWAAENNGGSIGSTTVSAGEAPKDLKRDAGTVAGVAAKSLPSVVTIEAQGSNGEGGTGTGFVYDKEGHILTNNHVVASAANGGDLTATFSDGKKHAAEVVGRAEGYDVAVIKLKKAPSGLVPLPLANSDQVAVGDPTIAIGAPFGLSNTVTTGIISAKNRPVASGDGSGSNNSYMSALQTDASINPGNSGGPLLDSRGAVIGINSAIQSAGSGGLGQSQAGSIGLGFAIPINQAKNVAEQLIKTGQPVYPLIGATVSVAEGGDGAMISPQSEGGPPAVTPDGPAAKAGLKAGDVITKFNDTPIDSGPTLIGQIWTHKPGDKVTITYKRDGKESTVDVILGERKGES
ncbi:S1C family serine protease [Streptomyces sp. NRRL F-5135]|uniref:S1C family serine protease n=1 Tax=Streptomyces sp. NRRL F-5135 TaxID=1463858 RepID=UPI0004C8A2A7|nr:trypsin-like peptidase domain-containing protein [Streptomyces sp. NRRL F-5135]